MKPDYPTDLVKQDYPDWISENIGLEITRAFGSKTKEMYINHKFRGMTFKDVIEQNYENEGHVIFNFTYKGEKALLMYDLKSRRLCRDFKGN